MYRLPDDFDKPEFSSVTIQRDLFYGYDTLMENVSDPSHIDFAHHKVRTWSCIMCSLREVIILLDLIITDYATLMSPPFISTL